MSSHRFFLSSWCCTKQFYCGICQSRVSDLSFPNFHFYIQEHMSRIFSAFTFPATALDLFSMLCLKLHYHPTTSSLQSCLHLVYIWHSCQQAAKYFQVNADACSCSLDVKIFTGNKVYNFLQMAQLGQIRPLFLTWNKFSSQFRVFCLFNCITAKVRITIWRSFNR